MACIASDESGDSVDVVPLRRGPLVCVSEALGMGPSMGAQQRE